MKANPAFASSCKTVQAYCYIQMAGQLAEQAYLCETEDVVNEQQHILTLSITEMLSHSQTCKQNTAI